MAAGALPRTIGVVGLGLMGASLARAVRAADPSVRIVAVEPRDDVRAQALADRVADEARAATDAALGTCDLAVLCTPVAAIEALLGPVSRLLPDGAVLTDVGGAKAQVVAAARAAVRPGVAFVGAHPMFGGHGGYAGASAEKWKGGTVAVCTDAPAEAAVERVVALHLALGAKVERCTAAEHDAAVAMVSHLPYLVASALAVAARGRSARGEARRPGPEGHDPPRRVPIRHPGRGRPPQRGPARGGGAPRASPRAAARRHRRLAGVGSQRARGRARREGGALLNGPLTCRRKGPLHGSIEVPGDKSISHRALLFGALSTGETRVRGLLDAEDVHSTRRAVEALGAVVRREGDEIVVVPPAMLREPGDVVDCGNSGTSLRLLTGVLSGVPGLSILTGDASLRRRPVRRVIDPLRRMGADLSARDGDRLPPVVVRGRPLHAARHVLEVASAQVKSACLLAGLFAEGETSVLEPERSRDHTERMLAGMGVPVRVDGLEVAIPPARPRGGRVDVPGDISSAAFFLCAAAALPGSEVTVTEPRVNPTRTGLLDVLVAMGARRRPHTTSARSRGSRGPT